jgi:hypothetical protein
LEIINKRLEISLGLLRGKTITRCLRYTHASGKQENENSSASPGEKDK